MQLPVIANLNHTNKSSISPKSYLRLKVPFIPTRPQTTNHQKQNKPNIHCSSFSGTSADSHPKQTFGRLRNVFLMSMITQQTVDGLAIVSGFLLFSQLGVLSRIYLDWLFSCDEHTGPCTTHDGTALFSDLFSNMLGSFIIGFVASCKQIKIEGDRQIAVLPAGHPWQRNTALQVAVRTGYCGCLTTYATWQLDLLEMIIGAQNNQSLWLQGVSGYIIGTHVSIMSLFVGEHVAAFLATRIQSISGKNRQRIELVQEASQQVKIDNDQSQGNGQQIGQTDKNSQIQMARIRQESNSAVKPNDDSDSLSSTNNKSDDNSHKQDQQSNSQSNNTEKQDSGELEPNKLNYDLLKRPTNIIVAILGIALFISMICLCIYDKSYKPRYHWFSAVFAPFGCILRWKLSVLNFKVKHIPWLPAGTFLANQIACIIDYIIEVISLKVQGISSLESAVMSGMKTGLAGSLSTVSTWVAEIGNAAKQIPDNFSSYWYTILTLGTSIFFGILIYGTVYWTH